LGEGRRFKETSLKKSSRTANGEKRRFTRGGKKKPPKKRKVWEPETHVSRPTRGSWIGVSTKVKTRKTAYWVKLKIEENDPAGGTNQGIRKGASYIARKGKRSNRINAEKVPYTVFSVGAKDKTLVII